MMHFSILVRALDEGAILANADEAGLMSRGAKVGGVLSGVQVVAPLKVADGKKPGVACFSIAPVRGGLHVHTYGEKACAWLQTLAGLDFAEAKQRADAARLAAKKQKPSVSVQMTEGSPFQPFDGDPSEIPESPRAKKIAAAHAKAKAAKKK